MLEFAHPWFLASIPCLVIWWRWRIHRADNFLPYPLPSGLATERTGHLKPSLQQGLRLGSIALLFLALAGPRVRSVAPLPPREGLALVFALDLSGSMGMELPQGGSRLDAAKEGITRFVSRRGQDRVGLVTFGETAVTRVPPTTDHAHLLAALGRLRVPGPREATALGTGLGLAAYASLRVPSPTRVVVLMTDGQSNAGTLQPLSAARAASRLGVRIHSIGVGPEVGEDPLDRELLESLAEAGGGSFHEAADARGLREVLASLDKLETGPLADRAGFQFEARHEGLLLLALVLLALEALLQASPQGRLS